MSGLGAKHILLVAGMIFLLLAATQVTLDRGYVASLAKARLLVGSLFAAVSAWLWLH